MVFKYFLRFTGYFAFALLIGLLFLLVRFPYDSLAERIETEASRQLGCELRIENLRYQFPFSLIFSRMELDPAGQSVADRIVVNSGRIQAQPLGLVSRKLGASLSGSLFSGSMQGRLQLQPILTPEQFDLDLDVSGINPAQFKLSEKIILLSGLRGALSGDLNVSGRLQQWEKTSGSGSLSLQQGQCNLELPGGKPIQLREMEGRGEFVLKDRVFNFETIAIAGRGIQGEAQASIGLKSPLPRSRLEMRGRLDFNSEAPQLYSLVRGYLNRTTLPFTVNGPLQNLRYQLD